MKAFLPSLLSFLIATVHVYAKTPLIVIGEEMDGTYGVTAHVFFDSTHKLKIDELINGDQEWITEPILHFPDHHNLSIIWMKFMIVNQANRPVYYRTDRTGLYMYDSVNVFQFRNGILSNSITGTLIRPEDKSFDSRLNILPLHMEAGDTLLIYLQFERKGLYVKSVDEFNIIRIRSDDVIKADLSFDAIYTGSLLMLIPFGMLMFWLFRDKLYLIMMLAVISHLAFFGDLNGLIHQLFDWSPYVSKYMNAAFTSWFFPFSSLFLIINYISLKKRGWLYGIGVFFLILMPAASLIGFILDDYRPAYLVSFVLAVFGFMVCNYFGFIKKERQAIILLLFMLPFMITSVLFMVQNILSINWFENALLVLQIGSFCSCLIIGYAVYDRVKTTITDRLRVMQEKETLVIEQNVVLEHKVEERTRELEIEKQKSDSILLNILPQEIAEELKETGGSEARLYENVTVLFTDFVGFTMAAEELTAKELVAELHNCFKGFDEIIQKHQLEKIKTVGDAYIAVAGLPVPVETHCSLVTKAAIDIRDFMVERKLMLRDKTFTVRIGIHSGPVVAGIVGMKKFAYDIWGDTVNTAARMEQHGEVGKVNISRTAYELLKDEHVFSFENRGRIEAKGKGEIEMYFVDLKTMVLT